MSCCCCSGFFIVTAIFLAIIAKFYFGRKNKENPKLRKEDYKKDIVYLFQFSRRHGLPNICPYCIKVETFLRTHKIQYEFIEGNFQRSQKGLLPFIELNGEQIADSEFIIEHLSKHFNIKDKSPKDVAGAGRAISRMFDTEISQIHIKFKQKEPEFLKTMLAGIIPGFLIPIFIPIAQWIMYRKLKGYAAFSESELKQLYRRNLQAASDILGERKFFGGDETNLADCSVFAHLVNVYYFPCPNDLKLVIDEFPNLKRLINTIVRDYFSDCDVVNHLKD
ncbi:hypothetical protein FO519_008064 [Halicephalobus sp. NKZ332]|nr:hypothetical protein FO519_008064 [Halicephalobus sp. NKZ332]